MEIKKKKIAISGDFGVCVCLSVKMQYEKSMETSLKLNRIPENFRYCNQ